MQTLTVSKVLLVSSDGSVLLIKRDANDTRRPSQWDIPGGHVESGETTAEAAIRETQEEVGIALEAHDLTVIYAMTEKTSEDLSVTWVFHLAQTAETEVTLSGEHDDFKWVGLDDAIAYIEYERQKRMLTYVKDMNLLA